MDHSRSFSSPAAAGVAMRSEWDAFQPRAIVDGVRPEIAASWRRSAQFRLDADLPAAPLDAAAPL